MNADPLYFEMQTAFAKYNSAEPCQRDHLWDAYIAARERYLKAKWGKAYSPLRLVLEH